MIERLVHLGLSSYEAVAYLTLLKKGDASPVEVAVKAKIPKQRVYDVLSSLHTKGFCLMRETTPKSYTAVDPLIALNRFRELEAQAFLESENRKRAESQHVAEKLKTLFDKGRSSTYTPPVIEVLKEEGLIGISMVDLLTHARKSVNLTMKAPFVLSERANSQLIEAALRKGLTCRVLVEESIMHGDLLADWMGQLQNKGSEVRYLPELPIKLSIFDDQKALLAIPHDEGGHPNYTGVVISHSKTVEFLNFAFDQLWVQSKKVRARKEA